MKISPEHQLMRILLLDAANLGAASGRVTLDRPTQVDACYHLPFIPDSALKGVLRAIWEVNGYPGHEAIFGKEHDLPGSLIFGNGELLAFPLLSRDGRRCWIFPAVNIFKFLTLEALCGKSTVINKLLAQLCRQDSSEVLGIPNLPELNLPFVMKQISPADYPSGMIELLLILLRHLGGNALWPGEVMLIVSDRIAKHLWTQAAEIREMTALKDNAKTAQGQTLRRVELIPANSIFLSFLTWLESEDLNVPDHIFQFGAWEGTGLGYCQLSIVDQTDAPLAMSPQITSTVVPPVESTYMTDVYRRVSELAQDSNSAYKDKVRSAIGSFGWRFKTAGWEAALAFELAKAKTTASDNKIDMRVHRWLLATLFDMPEDQISDQSQSWFDHGVFAAKRQEVMSRWLWLRKYSEFEFESANHGGIQA